MADAGGVGYYSGGGCCCDCAGSGRVQKLTCQAFVAGILPSPPVELMPNAAAQPLPKAGAERTL
jgi:hypothetical protein